MPRGVYQRKPRKKPAYKHVKQAQIQGMDKAKVLLEQQAQGELPKVLGVFADECLEYIWDTWPVKKGKTIKEIQVSVVGDRVLLVCLVEYSVYIVLKGDRRSALFTRFIPAIENNIEELVKKTTKRIATRGLAFIPGRRADPAMVAKKVADARQRKIDEREAARKKYRAAHPPLTPDQVRARDKLRKRVARAKKKLQGGG